MGQWVRWHLFFYAFKDDISATDSNINPQFLEDGFIFRVSDASYSPWNIKFMLGYLAGDQIIFIVTGYRDEHISSASSYFS